MIRVLFFAQLRELANTDKLELPQGDVTHMRDLLDAMNGLVPAELIDALRDESALVSIDHKYAGWDAELDDGAEVGILPPVSGG